MMIETLDLEDGLGLIPVVVSDHIAAERLRKYTIDAGDALRDREADRWIAVTERLPDGGREECVLVHWTAAVTADEARTAGVDVANCTFVRRNARWFSHWRRLPTTPPRSLTQWRKHERPGLDKR